MKLPSLLRTMPGATSAAQGRKSERREARRACSQRNIMGSAFADSGKRDVAARDGEDLRIAPRGEEGEAVADHRHDEIGRAPVCTTGPKAHHVGRRLLL